MKKMNNIRNMISGIVPGIAAVLALTTLPSCDHTQSYSELLREEEKAVNAFLAQRQVALNIPADSISFEMGENAPFYKLDEDGYVYMQVIDKGDMNARVQPEDVVYFRFSRQNINMIYQGQEAPVEGNANDVTYGSTYFLYKNTTLTNSTQWGTGIQMPLRFFGYGCEVNLVLKSYYGFATDQTYCIPYIINLKYFKPEY